MLSTNVVAFIALASIASLTAARPARLDAASADIASGLSPRDGGLAGALANIQLGEGQTLIGADILAGVLSPVTCAATPGSLVGLRASVILGPLLRVCLCVNAIGGVYPSGEQPCPQCPANAHSICGGAGSCSCACDDGFYSEGGVCIPVAKCAPPNRLLANGDGTSTCTCTSPAYTADSTGGCACLAPYTRSSSTGICALPPTTRARMIKKALDTSSVNAPDRVSQVTLLGTDAEGETDLKTAKASSSHIIDHQSAPIDTNVQATAVDWSNSYRCPNGETPCPFANGKGYECIDTASSLDSCGGCLSQGQGTNCLTIKGALAVSCVSSKCVVSSCFPGWRYSIGGKCVRVSKQ